MFKQVSIIFVAIIAFTSWVVIAQADVTSALFATADGSDDNWSQGSIDCTGADCYTEIDSETGGSECAGGDDGDASDSATFIRANSTGRQSFDIDESSIPDNSTVTSISVFSCASGTGGALLKYYVNMNGSNFDGVTDHSMTGTYTEYTEAISLSQTKTASSDIEIGALATLSSDTLDITEIWARITYTPPGNSVPSVTTVSIDSGASAVNLVENTTVTVSCAATIEDLDGYGEITSVKAELHRSGVAAGSADDNNNHYTLEGDSECIPSNGSGNTEDYTCNFAVQYYADPTDAGAFIAEDWECLVTPSDPEGEGSTGSDTIEMNSLAALNVTSTITHAQMSLGEDTGATNQVTTITNTGNINIDVEVSGTDLACETGSIGVDYQKFDTVDVTYASLTNSLSATPVQQDLDISQQTDDLTPSTQNLYWGVGVPTYGAGGSCTSLITFTSVADVEVD